MPQSPDLARAALKIEELPTDDGSVLDAIAGAILRILVRIKVHDRIMHRLAALERELEPAASPDRVRGNNGATAAR